MTIPGTSGRMRFDGTISLGHILVVLPLLVIIFAAGGWKTSIEDTANGIKDDLSHAIAAEHADVLSLKVQERNDVTGGKDDVAGVTDKVVNLSAQIASQQEQIDILQEDVRAFARSVGAPIPTKAAKKP